MGWLDSSPHVSPPVWSKPNRGSSLVICTLIERERERVWWEEMSRKRRIWLGCFSRKTLKAIKCEISRKGFYSFVLLFQAPEPDRSPRSSWALASSSFITITPTSTSTTIQMTASKSISLSLSLLALSFPFPSISSSYLKFFFPFPFAGPQIPTLLSHFCPSP